MCVVEKTSARWGAAAPRRSTWPSWSRCGRWWPAPWRRAGGPLSRRTGSCPPRCRAPSPPGGTVTWTGNVDHLNKATTSFADPNPDPSDLYVFGPPGFGSGSISQRHGFESGSFYLSSSKKCKKNLDSYCSVTSFWLLFVKWYKCTSKSNSRKPFLLLVSWRSMTKTAGSGSGSIRGMDPGSRSGSTPKCHGSGTLSTDNKGKD